MAKVIDADTHVLESERTWEFLEADLQPRRPIRVSVPTDTLYGTRNSFWLIDGNIVPKPAGKGGGLLFTPTSQQSMANWPDIPPRELGDIPWRIRDMGAMGVDVQVIYPTLFLPFLTHDALLEAGLCRAYNRFLASAWDQEPERLRWVVVPPLRSIAASIDELRFGAEHGAVGVFFRGIEDDRTLDDPYFFPVYEEAANLDLPICIHTGAGCPNFSDVIDVSRSSAFPHGRLLPLISFRNIIANGIPQQFPTLRFAFVETGASWVPYVVHNLGAKGATLPSGPELFEECRIYVAYEEREDLSYLLTHIGEDHLFAGSDYGHHGAGQAPGDPSAQPQMVTNLRARDLPPRIVDKILGDNARRLYALR